MADLKISQLTGATTPLAGTEVLPIVQSGTTVKVAVSDLTAGRTVATASTTATGQMSAGTATPVAGSVLTLQESASLSSALRMTNRNSTQIWRLAVDAAAVDDKLLAIIDGSGGQVAATVAPTTGNVTLSLGNLIQGTAAKGINFTANTPAAGMTSQLLNWYEEGTWTPVFTPSTSGSITLTSPTNSMRYTRVGRLVTLTGLIDVASVSSPVGDLRLTGIPFNVGGSGAGSVSVYGLGTTSTATAYQVLVDSGSATTVFIRGYDAGNQVATVANNVQGGSGFYLTIQYTV
jgi:hypothetical protein